MGSNPWSYIGVIVLAFAGGIVLLSLLSSLLIAVFSNRHAQKTTQTVLGQIEKKLPGTDCGQCGCKKCKDYAALALNQEVVTPCPYCTEAVNEEIESSVQEFWKLTEQKEAKMPKGWRKFGS